MEKQKYFKTIIQIEVLSDFLYDPASIDSIHHDIVNGECSGLWEIKSQKELTKDQMRRALRRQGSDPEFLIQEES